MRCQWPSISAASRVLNVNHATVLRRVAAFEQECGGPVFQKTATGYRVLPDRATVIEAAREVENAVVSVERLMHGGRAAMRGLVRVSSTDSLSQFYIAAGRTKRYLLQRIQHFELEFGSVWT